MINWEENKMKKVFLIALMAIATYNSNCQIRVDSVLKFKMLLFLNWQTQQGSFADFEKCLDLDTLQISGNMDYTELTLAPKFEFYKIKLKKSVRYNISHIKQSSFHGFP